MQGLQIPHFNPRPPQGERPLPSVSIKISVDISIHAPRKGSDFSDTPASLRISHFNPRPPQGERRLSIDSPCKMPYFNPRPPQGERLLSIDSPCKMPYFNPRPPQGERPSSSFRNAACDFISIHAPRKGSDCH